MHIHRAVNLAIVLCSALFMYLIVPAAQAGIFYDVAVRGTYEDNVIGLLSDKRGGYAGMPAYGPMMGVSGVMSGAMMGPPSSLTGSSGQSKSDTSINLFADLGASIAITSDASLFVLGSAQHTSYSTNTQFNYTIGGLSTGIYKGFGEVLSGKFAINGSIKNYQDPQRDGSAYGATLLLKEQFTPAFWLKEAYDYEKNDADSPFFTYNGNEASIWAGYLVTPRTTVLAGYYYLARDYDQPSGFKVTSNTLSLGLEHEFAKKWFFDAQYSHQMSDSNVAGTSTTDNIYSIGLRYSF